MKKNKTRFQNALRYSTYMIGKKKGNKRGLCIGIRPIAETSSAFELELILI